jgi:hypothetical protein
MAVIVRDAVASDQLVYAWPFPIGPEPIEITCGEEEIAVVCPAWIVHERLGPGRHQWRTPDPAKPTNVYFVLTGPVEVPFDMMTSFVIPATQQPVRLRAQGSLLIRCMDPAILVSQFVGLPFDNINDGVVRSVATSVERLLARVLVRRVLGGGTPIAVTDPSMLPSIVDEATAYNPTAGAVTGVGFVRFNQLVIVADDGGMGGGMYQQHGWNPQGGSDPNLMHQPYSTGAFQMEQPYSTGAFSAEHYQTGPVDPGSGNYAYLPPATFAEGSQPPSVPTKSEPAPGGVISGEIGVVSGEIGGNRRKSVPPGQLSVTPDGVFATGSRVLVSSPDGLLHASTVRQHSQGYYEVEIGSTGQTVWVPASQVIPEQ